MSESGKRVYRSELRTEQASQTRRQIVAAAADLFDRRGYQATHLRDIASAAGVSVQSVHLNGPKSALLLAALEYVSLGVESGQDVTELPQIAEALRTLTGPDDFIRWLADFATTSNQRVSGIWQALEHAATEDPDVAAAFTALVQRMRRDAHRGVEILLELAGEPSHDALQQRADLLWALTVPDLYRHLVLQAGWSAEEYTAFLERALRSALLQSASEHPSSLDANG